MDNQPEAPSPRSETLQGITRLLREQREDHPEVTQGTVSDAMARRGLPLRQATVSSYERYPERLAARGPEFTEAFLRAYELPEDEVERIALELFKAVYSDALQFVAKHPGEHLLPPGTQQVTASQFSRVDHVGTVSAGNGGSGILVTKKTVSVPDWIANQFDLDYVFAADVDGSSMTCEDVARTIPQGATAFFHRPSSKMQPRASDIVYAYVPARDQSVIKIYQPAKGFALLTSFNDESEPIVVNESNPATVQGIYLGLETRAPRFR